MWTKLAPPVPADGHLGRPELVELLTATHPVVLISAPAGWGKTSLLAAWHTHEAERRRFAFLRLEPDDDATAIFWTYVIESLRTLYPELMPGAEATLRTSGVDPMRQIVPALVNELVRLNEPVVLVLDDYHVVTNDDIHASVSHLVDHMPPAVSLAIATRADPPLQLSRLRASGQLLEVRAAQLGFSHPETAAFLGGRFGLDLGAAVTQRLCDRTEGWPAALQLAGISLQRQPDPLGYAERFAGDDRNVADYLVGEVLGSLDAERKDFLLRTAVLDRLSGPLCDAVAGVTGSAAILDDLERSGLFVVPLDQQRRWYRYHHLFGDWLRHELRTVDGELVPKLHGVASRWYADNELLEPAIGHAIAARDHSAAAQLLDRYFLNWSEVNWSRVARWLAQIPDDVASEHALAAVAHVWLAMAHGEIESGVRWLKTAEGAADAAPPGLREHVDSTLRVWRAFVELVAGDIEQARLQALQIADRERRDRNVFYGAVLGVAAVSTFWSVGALEAIPLLTEAAAARKEASLNDSGLTSLLSLAYAEVGDWNAAEHAAAEAFALPSPDREYRYPHLMFAHYAAGKVRVAHGDRDEGIEQIDAGLELARGWVDPIGAAYGCLAAAEAIPDYAQKRALVREARELMSGKWGRGRIIDLLDAAEHKLAMRRPAADTAGTVVVEALTDRELDVLRLLRGDLSLREIAGELYISHNTVKGYTKSIYRKLGVSSREAAIAAGAELDLL